MLPFGLATHCQRVTAPDAAGVSSEFSDCPVMLVSCQKAVAIIVSNDLTEQDALNTELRSLSAWSVSWSVASETLHSVSLHPHFPSVTFGDAVSGVPFSVNHNNCHNNRQPLTSTQPPQCKILLHFVKSLSVNMLASNPPDISSGGVTNLLSAFWRLTAFDLVWRTYRRGVGKATERQSGTPEGNASEARVW